MTYLAPPDPHSQWDLTRSGPGTPYSSGSSAKPFHRPWHPRCRPVGTTWNALSGIHDTQTKRVAEKGSGLTVTNPHESLLLFLVGVNSQGAVLLCAGLLRARRTHVPATASEQLYGLG